MTLPSKNFREVVETPFSVGLGMHAHKTTCVKKLIEKVCQTLDFVSHMIR